MTTCVFGVLRQPGLRSEPLLREHTLSWAQWDYHGRILEGRTVDDLLGQAADAGYRYCYVQRVGNVVAHYRRPEDWRRVTVPSLIADWVRRRDFFATGYVVGEGGRRRLSERCLLVDLGYYEAWGRPAFGDAGEGFLEASAQHGPPVLAFSDAFDALQLDLAAGETAGLEHYLHHGLAGYDPDDPGLPLTEAQRRFLARIHTQTRNARRGVFLWNLESYHDIDAPPAGFAPPLTSLYSVAAGFKAHRILHTHGATAASRMVFFDYSERALEVKRVMHAEWDGTDFPAFARGLFRRFPYPATFYQLWTAVDPADLPDADLERYWQAELAKWGGAEAFRAHWDLYRTMAPEFVHVNLLGDRGPLLEAIRDEPNAMIWWSNAFFTSYGNWHHRLAERKRLFETWIAELVAANPALYVTGADHINIDVNHVQVGRYWERYQELAPDPLDPRPFHKVEMVF